MTPAQQERVIRRAAIRVEDLRTAAQIVARFGVSEPTARTDLRAVWGDDAIGGHVCPHCGATLSLSGLYMHEPVCVERPDMRARVREALEDPARPGYAIGVMAYRQRAAELGATSHPTLLEVFGDWGLVCAWAGLKPSKDRPPKARVAVVQRRDNEAAAIAEVEAALEADARLRESLHTRGLEVCAVREIDGGRRVAYMLR